MSENKTYARGIYTAEPFALISSGGRTVKDEYVSLFLDVGSKHPPLMKIFNPGEYNIEPFIGELAYLNDDKYYQEKHTSCETLLKEKDAEIAKLSAENDRLRGDNDRLQYKLGKSNDDRDRFGRTIVLLETEIEGLEADISDLNSELLAKNKLLAEHKDCIPRNTKIIIDLSSARTVPPS